MQLIEVEVFVYLFTVKDRECIKVEIPANGFNIFGSIFGVLFCLLIKKLMLGSKTIWQSMRKFPCSI